MNVKAIPMSNLMEKCDDIYKSVMICAQRARQIIDERVVLIEENEDVDDSIQLIEPEIIIEDTEKPMIIALEEYLNGELEWRFPPDNEPELDEISI